MARHDAQLVQIPDGSPLEAPQPVSEDNPLNVIAASGGLADVGGPNETAPSTDTATSGLNGRLQRIAQRLTSLIALVPASLGQKTSAASFAVVVASDQTALSVGAIDTYVSSTPTLSVAGAYVTGDYVGPTTTPASFANAVRTSGGKARIQSLVISDKLTTAAVALELWVFSATFVAPTDNAAWAISDAEAITCLGVIPIPTTKWYASSNNKVYSDDTLNLVIKPAATTLFYALVARGSTPTWTDGDLTLNLGIVQD